MSLNRFVRQLKPIQENKVNYVEEVQNLYEAAQGLSIVELQKVRKGKPKLYTLIDVLNNQTKIQTTKGDRTISWLSQLDKTAMESGDLISAFLDGKRYKQVFMTDKGEKITLKDILKSEIFGGGRGSGGGSENTTVTESLQCVYCSEVFNGVKGEDVQLNALKSKDFEIDESLDKIEKDTTDDWVHSSIMIANEMKKRMSGKYIFHRGSPFVKLIDNTFKDLNKKEPGGKPFANINKWNPADIWCQKKGFNPNFNWENLGSFNNYLKEMYDVGNLIGVSLKKVTGSSVPVKETNTTGFVRRPVKLSHFILSKKTFMSAKDIYIYVGKEKSELQLRTFGDMQFQGAIIGSAAYGGKIGGGVLIKTVERISRKQITQIRDAKQKTNPKKLSPQFLQEFYELFLGLNKDRFNKRKMTMKQDDFNKELQRKTHDWIYSKYMSMSVLSVILSSGPRMHDITDAIAGYSISQSDMSGPYIKYGD